MSSKADYNQFKKAMDTIASEIPNNKTALAYSGGVDSTAILLSLVDANAKFSVIHMRYDDAKNSYGIFLERMVSHICRKFKTPALILPKDFEHFYELIADSGVKNLVDGEGMDRMYLELHYEDGSPRQLSFGEPFRAYFPLVEMLFFYAPNRFASYGVPKSFHPGDKEDLEAKEIEKKLDIKIIKYSYHPEMLKFFKGYKEDVADIFFRKRFTEMYVKDKLGMSFNSLVREVYRLNHSRFKSFGKRFFELNARA